MAKKSKKVSRKKAIQKKYCSQPRVEPRQLPPGMSSHRARAILVNDKKWANGTELRYHFFRHGEPGIYVHQDGTREWMDFSADEDELDVVRSAFDKWSGLGIGLSFTEVDDRRDAEVRIGFLQGDGSWSYMGRDIVSRNVSPPNLRTMNFGWGLSEWDYGYDTALHEIGHTLGLPHEHQNPKAGIVWDEAAVIAHFRQSDGWEEADTRRNILNKIPPYTVTGSNWDKDSIMHYEFDAGLIIQPEEYQVNPLTPANGLSSRDVSWVKSFYPPLSPDDYRKLGVNESQKLDVLPGSQANFLFRPNETRHYRCRLFGEGDCVMVLFETDAQGGLRYASGEDDTALESNGSIRHRFRHGQEYVIRVRVNYSVRPEELAIMIF